MKKVVLIGLLFCLVMSLTACDLKEATPEGMHESMDKVVGWFGKGQLSVEDELIGKRDKNHELFTGAYHASPNGVTGRDVVFGGSSIIRRVLRLEATIKAESGTATVRVRMNDEAVRLTPDADGKISTELHFTSGGNYIMVDYADFSGTVELVSSLVQEGEQP